ncbi:MAG: hypothetical protein H6682_17960 [Candidatus Eisenbacteria bacterium]|nr:hypothetical protein [Candidatus Eisenbacteria bacterium]
MRKLRIARRTIACAMLYVSMPMVAHSASIEGEVLPLPPRQKAVVVNPYPGRAHTSTAHAEEARPTGAWKDVVVFLRGDDLPTRATKGKAHELAQRGKAFVPHVLPIEVGDRVEFPNFDPFYHNVFSYSPVKRFDLGKYAEGQSSSIMFPDPGEVRIFCDIHSEMNAVILVMGNRFFTQPDESGHFQISDVPPGRYELVLWHPDRPEQARTVDVPVSGLDGLTLGF